MRSLLLFNQQNSNGLVMGVTVGANGLSIVHKGSGGEANATLPDVCLTKVASRSFLSLMATMLNLQTLLVALRLSLWMVATVSRSKVVRFQKVPVMRVAIKRRSIRHHRSRSKIHLSLTNG